MDLAVKGKMGQETKVDYSSSKEKSRFDEILNSDHFAINAKDDI